MIQEPNNVTPPSNPAPRTRPTGLLRIGLVIGACALLAIPVASALAAASPSTSQPAAAAPAANPSASADPGAAAAPGTPGRPDGGAPGGPKAGGPNGPKAGGPNGPGAGPITITAITSSQISLKTDDGWTRTITATSSTVVTKGGQTISVGGLKVGDEIHFQQTRNSDGTYTITKIDVPTPHAGGTVTAVTDSTITVTKKDGTTTAITVTSATVYTVGPNKGSATDVKVGSDIDAQGTVSGATFTASAVNIRLPHVDGQVTAKTSDSITVKGHDGKTNTIHVTSATTYAINGATTGSLSDIAVGDQVHAEGTLRADGSIDAVAVHEGPPAPP